MTTPTDIEAILNGPALAPPPGISPQIQDPYHINIPCLIVTGIFLCLAILSFCMRIYTKWIILRNVAKEDYYLVVGMIFLIIYTSLAFKAVALGAGTHQWNIRVKNMESLLFYIYITEIIYGFSVCFIKASILFQYLRIFFPVKKSDYMYIGCWATLWLNVLFYTLITFLTIFACTPRNKYWDPLVSGHCLDNTKKDLATGSFNVITDFVLVLLPQYDIWKLHISRRKKVGVAGIFLVALCGCVTSIMRLYYSVKLSQTKDVSYNVVYLGTTGMAEASISVLCCSILVSPKFFQVVINPKIQYLAKSNFWTKSKSKSSNIWVGVPKYSNSSKLGIKPFRNQANRPYSTLGDNTELRALKTKESDAVLIIGAVSEPDLAARGARMTRGVIVEDSLAPGIGLDLEEQWTVGSMKMG